MTEDEFYKKIPEWIGAEKSAWNHVTLFAYFCSKYEDRSGIRFKMVRSKAGPTSTKETRDFSKLINLFCSDTISEKDDSYTECRRAALLKAYNYINWMFDFKFKRSCVSGTQIFLSPSIMNEFERMYASHLSNKKASSKIGDFLLWCKKEMPDILDQFQLETKEELSLFVKYVENSSTECLSHKRIMDKIMEMKLL